MPRDAAATRDALIRAGRELMARPGGLATPVKDIVGLAGQRNVSALHYHFGGRRGLIDAIVQTDGQRIEDARRVMLDTLDASGSAPTLKSLIEALVTPQVSLLDEPTGRQFLSIVSQLVDLFDRWDEPGATTPPQALRVFRAIEQALPAGLPIAVRRQRVTLVLEFVSSALGARARQIDAGRVPTLGADEFLANLVAMAAGALAADSF